MGYDFPMDIYLIRHGRAETRGEPAADEDRALTAEYLAGLGGPEVREEPLLAA